MKIISTEISEVKIIEPEVFGDIRGWFFESYNKQKFFDLGIKIDFIQDNHSMSTKKGTLRGLHFQIDPKSQSKLIKCVKGSVLDVVVDLREGSPTFKKYVKVELAAESKRELFIPKGFGHGFLTLTNDAEVEYKVDQYYSKEHDRSIRYNDPELNIDWGISNPILSEKDKVAPLLKDSDINFKYGEV